MRPRNLQSQVMDRSQIPGIVLREQTEEDQPFLAALHRGAILQAMGVAVDDADPVMISLAEMQVRARALGHATDWPGAWRRTAWLGPDRVGAVVTSLSPQGVHVVDIAVDPSRRRQGVGRAMLEAVLGDAARDGLEATARILTSNTASLALFAAAGFDIESGPGEIQFTVRWSSITNM